MDKPTRWNSRLDEHLNQRAYLTHFIDPEGPFVVYEDHLAALIELDELRSILRKADKCVIWEQASPHLGDKFQERVEKALGISD